MNDATTLQLSQSVFQYLTEPSLRAGLDSVLDYGSKKLPPGLEWGELPQYFRAARAARSVQTDWTLALEQLWRCVWPSQIPGWSPASLDEQSTRDFDAHVSIDKCWSEEWFGRCFTRPSTAPAKPRRQPSPDVLCLGVSITLQGASIGVSIDPSPTMLGPDQSLFHYDDDAAAWWSHEHAIIGQSLDLSSLQSAARQALKWVSESSRGEIV